MKRLVIVLVTCAISASASAAAGAAQLVARESAPFTAAAARGVVAWSGYDPASRRYRLKLLRDGVVRTPAIPDRGRPFDVDLGRLVGGGVGAVYSRCADDAALTGCDLYLYDVAAGTERRIASASSPTRSEVHPSLEGGLVAFARRYGERSVLYVGRVDGEPASVRQPAPLRGAVDDLELNAGRLFYVWADLGRLEFGRDSLYRVRSGRAVRMYATESGGANESDFVGPTFSGRYVYFGETNRGSGTGNRLYRATVGGGRLDEAPGSATFVSADWTGDRFVTAADLGDAGVLEISDPVAWRPASRLP